MTLEELVEEALIAVGGRPWTKPFEHTYLLLISALKCDSFNTKIRNRELYSLSQENWKSVEKGIRDFKAQCVKHNQQGWQQRFGDTMPDNRQFLWTMYDILKKQIESDQISEHMKLRPLRWKRKT